MKRSLYSIFFLYLSVYTDKPSLSLHDWRITMNSLSHSAKILRYGLALISAAFLFQADNVLAAEAADDAQMQARDLLSGTVGGRAKTIDESPNRANGQPTSNVDPQEQARRLILGQPNVDGTHDRAAALESTVNATPAGSARADHGPY